MSNLAQRVCQLPRTYETGDRSTAVLLKESGFLQAPEALQVQEVEQVLREEPQLAQLWMKRGSDQRIAGGWGLEREDQTNRVRNFETGECLSIADDMRACAEFVVRYVRFIGSKLRPDSRQRGTLQ